MTDAQFGAARIISVQPSRLVGALRAGLRPVVAGFQGGTVRGDITTLGRGGSDITAVALGAALDAEVEIFKDVQGIMTADPRIVPAARRLARMTYEDVIHAGWLGARVLHPRAAELARENHLHLSVRPLLGESTSGTEFVSKAAGCAPSIVVVHTLELDHATVSVVGSGIRKGIDGVSRAERALIEANVPVLAIGSDDTQAMISCLVPRETHQQALRALHRAFVEREVAGRGGVQAFPVFEQAS